MTQNRRDFIKVISIASASALPVVSQLASALDLKTEEDLADLDRVFNSNPEFYILDNNLTNLRFYFINVKKSGKELTPAFPNFDSFMVVRLSQMHVSESGFWNPADVHQPLNGKPGANLSGFSYLAFRIWPDLLTKTAGTAKSAWGDDLPVYGFTKHSDKRLRFSLDVLLDWNNQRNFDLITMVEWFKLSGVKSRTFNFVKYSETDVAGFSQAKVIANRNNFAGPGPQITYEPKSSIYFKYRGIVVQLLTNNAAGNGNFVPVTLMEVPRELVLVPFYRDSDGNVGGAPGKEIVNKLFWKNPLYFASERQLGVTKYEVWNNQLFFQRRQLGNSGSADQQTFSIETPLFRAAGVITNANIPGPAKPADDCAKYCDDQKAKNELPSLLDKTELAYLTQFARDSAMDFTGQEFDIKELNGLFFTGLGVITHLRYDNLEKCPEGIDLIEYEHIITQGRDIFIRVARLGYNVKTGQRYKHVIEGKRKIEMQKLFGDPDADQPVSFIELKQYCECIDKHFVYDGETGVKKWADLFQNIPAGAVSMPVHTPVLTNPCDQKRFMFNEVEVVEKERIPIDCLQDAVVPADVCTLQCLGWFWPIKESSRNFNGAPGARVGVPDTDPGINFLLCEFTGLDWEGKKIKAATPFMFVRKSYIDDNDVSAAYKNYFKGNTDAPDSTVERRRIYFKSQKVAFTPALPKEYHEKGEDTTKNKLNIVETDYVEVYFNVKKKELWNGGKIEKIRYPVFPQVLCARVYIDHIKDLTFNKIPSVLEYNEDYIADGFINYAIKDTKLIGNGARLIMNQTDAYVRGKVEPLNKTYDNIKSAIQDAKSRLGNTVVPDINPFNLSLGKPGITDPKEPKKIIADGKATLDTLGRIANMSPAAFLGNTEILSIRVVDILRTFVPQLSDSPLFNLNKLMNEITGDVLNSPVYKAISDFKIKDPIDGEVATPDALIKKYDGKIQNLSAQFEAARKQLNDNIKQLADAIPDSNSIDNLVNALFEHYRTIAFDYAYDNLPIESLLQTINGAKTFADNFLTRERTILQEEYENKSKQYKEILLTKLSDAVKKLPLELQAMVDGGDPLNKLIDAIISDLFAAALANPDFDLFFKTVTETAVWQVGGVNVYYIPNADVAHLSITFEVTDDASKGKTIPVFGAELDDAGYLQLSVRAATLQSFIAANINGTKFQRDAANVLQGVVAKYNDALHRAELRINGWQAKIAGFGNQVAAWQDKVSAYLAKNPAAAAAVKDNIDLVQGALLQIQPFADFFRRYDPYYYYAEQQRLKQKIADIRRRFYGSLINVYGQVDVSGAITGCGTYDPNKFESVLCELKYALDQYQKVTNDFVNCAAKPGAVLSDCRRTFNDALAQTANNIRGNISRKALIAVTATKEYKQAAAIYAEIEKYRKQVADIQAQLNNFKQHYKELLQQQAEEMLQSLDQKVNDYINQQTEALLNTVDPATIVTIQQNIEEARNIYKLITSIKQQQLTYTWETKEFSDANLGIISFKKYSNPDTALSVNVNAVTYFSQGKFPPTIEKITTYAENRLTNFGICFFNSLTVGFSEVNFISGSETGTRFDVKIKDVKFDGALSFVQAFEQWFQTLGVGLIMKLESDSVVLGYSLPIPSIQTPAFSFFNLSLNFDLKIFFDSRPMFFGFSLARPESKFGIAAFIYAGFGYFEIGVDPKNGVVLLDIALEAGAWAGIAIGPIRGEVKLAFGFRYTKTPGNVHLEGYIVAEGRLSVWILEVYARIYLGIVSDNNSVDGVCIVTYSVKLGFISKSFTGTFHKHIAGAANNNSADRQQAVAEQTYDHFCQMQAAKSAADGKPAPAVVPFDSFRSQVNLSSLDQDEMDTHAVADQDFKSFINNY